MTACRITRLDKDLARALAPRLLSFTADQSWETWSPDNLLDDRPLKWELSRVASEGPVSGGRPLGYAILSCVAPGQHHLHRLATDPACRGQGIGAALMKEAAQEARRHGATLSLKVHKTNDGAARFYRRLGFVPGPEAGEYVHYSLEVPS